MKILKFRNFEIIIKFKTKEKIINGNLNEENKK